MNIRVELTDYATVQPMRELYRQEASCQVIHDSALGRGLAEPYIVEINGALAGYGAVWNRYHPGRVMEFYALPHARGAALPMFRKLIAAGSATSAEAQTNMPLMLSMLYDCAERIKVESILFVDERATSLPSPGGRFRRCIAEDSIGLFKHKQEPPGDWIIESDGVLVASGGFLCHYNPPYGDIYMEVEESSRRKGYGSYIVQEIKRACYAAGKRPACRCNPTNIASRATLQKAGFQPCARLLSGRIRKHL